MKRHTNLLVLLFIIGLSSCEKIDQEMPGKIPGMGNTGGELKLDKAFSLPQGVLIIGKITGLSGNLTGYSVYGSGNAVRVKFTILNTSDEPRTVFFPKGLIFKSDTPDYQNGLLLQTTWACVQANSERKIIMNIYCINLGVPGPDENASYTILGVTGSEVIKRLLDLIKWRAINYEMIYGTHPNMPSGTHPVFTYQETYHRLQTIVHNLTTNGINITSVDRAFIDSIPEIDQAARPQLDADSQYPAFFDEFKVSK